MGLPVLHNVTRVGGVGDRRRQGRVDDREAHDDGLVSDLWNAGTRINTPRSPGQLPRINSIPPIESA